MMQLQHAADRSSVLHNDSKAEIGFAPVLLAIV